MTHLLPTLPENCGATGSLITVSFGIKIFEAVVEVELAISIANEPNWNKGALYASLLLTSLHVGQWNNECLSITQGNSQCIVTTYTGTKQLLSGSFELWNIHKTFGLPEKIVEISGNVLQQLSRNV